MLDSSNRKIAKAILKKKLQKYIPYEKHVS